MQKTKRFYHYFVKSSNISKFNTFGGRRAILVAPMVETSTGTGTCVLRQKPTKYYIPGTRNQGCGSVTELEIRIPNPDPYKDPDWIRIQ
jgi:hypothetical protein